ncbi:succinate-semialdehyde dehydrogenase (NADP(+)) [Xaviernesmea oryzae]|uniref:Succinate-semialdehyde dehydrogenase (NADP(+)) n=1 Tax=Xaviernesmea oryzae TaxID=464029 RepID=A0A1Q9AXU8_9HYPH|nr:NAD-dependent succinate-semialdehyde dehydrogenase [Xaviernesmea oryzae]OLP60278.1 succinate-semialdehyde dehydrogenase (NADP(+)) [Xaviernesmea oryzae]SEK25192.1 succinate-semialdehyde dehydrogenase / glutarate-semialdehyde dehydrogenase [Xaviernesmea oryzae]
MSVTAALTSHLKDPSLITDALAALPESSAQFEVFDPATGALLATLPDMGAAGAQAAVDRASQAQGAWAGETAGARSRILRRWYELILAHADDLAAILTAEMGKPLAESASEVAHAAAYVEWYAEEAKRIYGETFPAPGNDRRMLVIKQPVGVTGTITPWNFPASMVARKVSPALAVGCTTVLKPAEQTPLVALALHALARQAGFPDGVFNLVLSSQGEPVGRVLCAHPKVRKISFTGSTEVGRHLMRQCADQIKKMSLELGGHAPFIVFADADLDAAVDGAIQAKFRNGGQTCVSANRLFVEAPVYDAFVERFAEATRRLKVGNGFDAGTAIGPLIDRAAFEKVSAHVDEALADGARLMTGGGRIGESGTLYAPTVLSEVTASMRVAREETFGPVAPILRFEDPAEVVSMANDTEYGLAAYFYATELKKVWRVAEALDYGMVGINTGRMSSEAAPFGGVKQSGMGREGSRHGAEEYLDMKYLCMGNI